LDEFAKIHALVVQNIWAILKIWFERDGSPGGRLNAWSGFQAKFALNCCIFCISRGAWGNRSDLALREGPGQRNQKYIRRFRWMRRLVPLMWFAFASESGILAAGAQGFLSTAAA
jgi:hypothetical protein